MVVLEIICDNILNANEKYILHQCNTTSTTSKGLALQIFTTYPTANTYGKKRIVGTCDVIDRVINLYGQESPGKPTPKETKNTRLDWFKKALSTLDIKDPIAVPYKIGCGLAGGDWNDYLDILISSNLDFVVYRI
jgi:hypothetical protein